MMIEKGKTRSHSHSRHLIRSLRARVDLKRSVGEKVADFLTSRLGSMSFLILNLTFFAIWIILNTRVIPGLEPFDKYPFHFLTFTVSLEAIFLATVVLISQNRAAKIEDLREEVDLQVDIIAEKELTKVVHLLVEIMRKQGIAIPKEAEVNEMMLPLDTQKIEKVLMDEVVEEIKS